MNIFWDEEAPFMTIFDEHHITYIVLMAVLLFLIITQAKYLKEHAEQIRKIILVTSIGQQILLYSWYIFETGFDVSESLPLHISRISSILGIIFLFTKNKKVLNVLFYFGIFAYGSFFYPSRVYPVYHAVGISFFINHAITILLPIFAAVAYDWRPSKIAAFKAYGWFLIYFFFVYFLNPLIDGNYFYLKHRPFFDFLPDYIYVPGVLIVTLGIFILAHYLARLAERVATSHKFQSTIEKIKLTFK